MRNTSGSGCLPVCDVSRKPFFLLPPHLIVLFPSQKGKIIHQKRRNFIQYVLDFYIKKPSEKTGPKD
jgi:hypothetical protein